MKIAIIKYNAGNSQSVAFALERLHLTYAITDNKEEIQTSDKVIFPGVGEASTTMKYLQDTHLDKLIKNLQQPVLGICLGMQLMCQYSEENNTPGLGIFDETVKRFHSPKNEKIPHMGWNELIHTKDWISHDLNHQFVYFVHSYFVPLNNHTVSTTEYIQPFSSAMRKKNFYAVQFHPEKSAQAGEQIIQSFINHSSN